MPFLIPRLMALGTACVFTFLAHAADGPIPGTQPLRLVIPYPAGGPADVMGRQIAERLGKRIHRSIIVEDKPGAAGELGSAYVAHAEPDGTTILLNSSSMSIDPVVKKHLGYNALRDFTPVTTMEISPLVVLVNPKLPAKNIAQLVAYAKAHPGKLNYGSSGLGSSLHMATAQFELAAGIRMEHIPYKGSSQSVIAAVADDIQVLFNPIPVALFYAKNGNKLRALAVTTAKRSPIWPDLPSVSESGIPGLSHYDASIWHMFFVPAKTPTAVVDYLNANLVAILHEPDMVQWLRNQGMQALGDTPAEAKQRMTTDIAHWTEVVRMAGIKSE
ncbi:Bug family tripartite tricarboxylate transporter substrate binding protein [Candidimonas humi]|uniref:Bug family tripartite tricarboxylate transporter substrate binding protein n=1 Tax=Candidimonas humi TaxID=683355 RepID=A0ABV8NYN7_9BURK|nr:tripartite tricarboxylate transporter substrate binding protein [Candidimonas humi]